jgi:hypothetical protein
MISLTLLAATDVKLIISHGLRSRNGIASLNSFLV